MENPATASADPFQADFLVDFLGVGPVLIHLHMEEEVHLTPRIWQFGTRRLADRPDARAFLAENNRFLALARNDDLLMNFD
jgi:hypothetical protein